MDDLNLCKSFNGLLKENNEGWIITKNEKGKIKIATCQQDETNIYEKTRDWIVINADKTRTDHLQLPKNELYKVMNVFVRDLLDSQLKDGYFLFRNIPYINVFICGTIVSLYMRNDKYSIIVDDGTSSIKCIIAKQNLRLLKEDGETDFSVNKNSSSTILKAAAMTVVSNTFLNKSVPEFEELELGNIVKILGNLADYNGLRYIFIQKITKEPKGTIYHCQHLDNVIHLYTEVFGN